MAKRQSELAEIKLELTHRCPLYCIHCSSNAGPTATPQMEFDEASRVIEEGARLGVRQVVLSGGEPLLWPGLEELVQRCVGAGARTAVYTSGNTDGIAPVANRLRAAGLEKMVFSVFAASDAAHDEVTRVAGSLRRTLQAVAIARDAGLVVEFHFVPMDFNYKQLPSVAAMARQNGVSRVSVLRFVPHGRGGIGRSLVLSRRQNLQLRRMIESENGTDGMVRVGSPYGFLLLDHSPECTAADSTLCVAPDGRLHACDAFKGTRAAELVGTDSYSLLGDRPLSSCWERSPYLRAIREARGRIPTNCMKCTYAHACGGGCLAQRIIASGSLKGAVQCHDPLCAMAGGMST